MNLKTFLLVLLSVLLAGSLEAQIDPPDFDCIRNDSLFWTNNPSGCGPYLGTVVYRASSVNGPYTEIDVLTDATANTYSDPNPMGQLRYYYLAYRYDCPGEPVLNSDSLNNLIPFAPSSTWVSVEDSTVVINWTASSSPQTSGYVIFRNDPLGRVVIGQVSGAGTTSFTDNSFTSQPDGETYVVAAIDPCGNQSLLGPEVTTSTLTLSGGNGCVSVISANTNAGSVSTSPLPVFSWTLFVSVNGQAFVSAGDYGGGTDNFTYDLANDGDRICLYAEARVQGQSRPLRTPIECLDVAITQPVRPLRLLGGGFDVQGNFCYDLEWNELAAVDLLQLNLVNPVGESMSTMVDFGALSGPVVNLCQPAATLPAAPFSLNLRVEDVCDNVVITNTLQPAFLSGQITASGVNTLNWTSFTSNLDASVSYRLERTALDGSLTVLTTGAEGSFTDRIAPTDANLALSCYQLFTTVVYPDGFTATYASERVCLEQQPMVYLPNVFSPNAGQILNREFCPGFARLPTGAYQLDIYDRWGGHVFSSSDPADCWEGDYRGRPAEMGVYLYVLRLEIGNRVLEKKGDVTLLR